MTFPDRVHVLRHYKNEVWEGIVVGQIRSSNGRLIILCESIGKEFKFFASDPSHLEIKDEEAKGHRNL